MSKFVMVKFSDGDYRVYTKRTANKHKLESWQAGKPIKAERVAENTDKEALIAMARLAREEYAVEYPNETRLVDRTDVADSFP